MLGVFTLSSRGWIVLFGALLLCGSMVNPINAQVGLNPAEVHPGRLRIDLEKARVLGTVMYIAAHPDDENTALLATLALGRKYRTVYLSVTRGDGGQNLIGSEQGELLGLIRTHELLQARRIDGAEQLFTRAVDFGFCKSPEEAFAVWNHDSVLADVVWAVRSVRPDVIIARFPTDGSGGHGHHTASALLAEEAFEAAADPKRFPEQLRVVRPWQVQRVYWNAWTPGSRPGQASNEPAPSDWYRVNVGEYNRELGMSYTELAGLSRSQHKSQGFGAAQRRGDRWDYLKVLKSVGPAPKGDFMEGIDVTWSRIPGDKKQNQEVDIALSIASSEWQQGNLDKAHAALDAALSKLTGTEPYLELTRNRIHSLMLRIAGVVAEATVTEASVVAGAPLKATVNLIQRGSATAKDAVLGALSPNQLSTAEVTVATSELASLSTPYWLRQTRPTVGRFGGQPVNWLGLPQTPLSATPSLERTLTLGTTSIPVRVPIVQKWVDPVNGERTRPLEVGPAVVVRFEETAFVFQGKTRSIGVRVAAHSGPVSGNLRLVLPAGWSAKTDVLAFSLAERDADSVLTFTLTASGAASGSVRAEVETGGQVSPAFDRVRIRYDHIPWQTVFRPAEARLVPLNVQVSVRRVGYVMGAGDEVPAALRQLGLSVDLLSEEQLNDPDPDALARYEAIVVGVRAYNTRPAAKAWVPRLTRYAEKGGTVVVQYQTSNGLLTPVLGPYPFAITRTRITDETAALQITRPAHPSLTYPNLIAASDFEGWVQERGLYFASSTDARFVMPLEGNDAGEAASNGMLLIAPVGKGNFVYTGLAFFRQLPAGVPGAYRLFANLLSLSAAPKSQP
jgi:LmbE family N-acetylglucosaminyl deacetylase